MLQYASLLPRTTHMARSIPTSPLLVVLGATGTGKSQLAVELAQRFNGEIINGDAMQMYKGLPIVTNKITVEEQQGIPHHLLGFIGLDEEPWRGLQFKKRAQDIIQNIRSRDRLPILVGGTHYYTQGLLFKGSAVGAEDKSDTEDLSHEALFERFPILDAPVEAQYEKLKEVDPVMAERWHPNDQRKIQNSLIIYFQTGKRASDIYAEQKQRKLGNATGNESHDAVSTDLTSTLLFWVHSDRDVLNQRLNSRVEKMMENGLEEEVVSMESFRHQRLSQNAKIDQTRGIWVSIGWKEFDEYLQARNTGEIDEAKMRTLRSQSIERTQAATRQYAKRQVQWIRHKLIPALTEERAKDYLYLVDSTNVREWGEKVYNPAVEVTDSFLKGLAMRPPQELSAVAKLNLDTSEVSTDETPIQRECEVCKAVLMSGKQWEVHLQSRRHKSLVRKSKKIADQTRYLNAKNSTQEGGPTS